MTENYWTTGADDDQSRCTITPTVESQVTLDEHGEIDSVTYQIRPAKPAVLLHKRGDENA